MKKYFKNLRQPGVEPGSAAWKATMLTATPPTLIKQKQVSNQMNMKWFLKL